MRIQSYFLLALLVIATAWPAQAQRKTKARKPTRAAAVRGGSTATADALPKGVTAYIQKEEGGQINWTTQFIEAEGEGIIDNERFKNPAQARALAIRAATVVAQRNLLEIVKGVNVTSETTVEDMITTKDIITTKVEGVVKGAEMIGQPVIADGSVKVRLRMPLYGDGGLAPAIYDDIPTVDPTPSPIKLDTTEQAPATLDPAKPTNLPDKGLVFNMKGQPFDPALFPVVTDSLGNILFDMKKIYDPTKGKFPVIVNSTRQALELAGLKKGVQVLDVLSAKDGKIAISTASSKKVNWAKILDTVKTIGKFLLMLL